MPLAAKHKKRRLSQWNSVRKVDRKVTHLEIKPLETEDETRAVIEPEELRAESEPDTAGKAVLGRLELVRKGSGEERLDPRAELLSWF